MRLNTLILVALLITSSTFAQNFWTQTNGPYGGTVITLKITQNGTIFASTSAAFKSTDYGQTWEGLKIGGFIHDFEVSSDTVVAGNDYGDVYISKDFGKTWNQIGDFNFPVFDVMILNGKILAAGDGIWQFADTGWVKIMNEQDIRVLFYSSFGYIFAASWGGGVFRSTDGGKTWNKVGNTVLNPYLTYVKCFAEDSDGNIYAGAGWEEPGYGVLFISSDSGKTWKKTSLQNVNVSDITIVNGTIYAATWRGVFKSSDKGSSWQPVNNGLSIDTTIYAIEHAPNGDIFIGSKFLGVRRLPYGSNSWEQTKLTQVPIYAINTIGQTVFVCSQLGIFRSSDLGASWKFVQTGTCYGVTKDSSYIFAVFMGAGVMRSSDGGDTWEYANQGLLGYTIAIASGPDGALYVADADGVYKSTDFGQTWEKIFDIQNAKVIAIKPSGEIFVGIWGGGVYRSTDGGRTWQAVNNGLTDKDVTSMVINSKGDIFVGTYRFGVFKSTDNGDSWHQIISGLGDTYITGLAVNSEDDIFAGTYIAGVYRLASNASRWDSLGLPGGISGIGVTSNGYLFVGQGGKVYRSSYPTKVEVKKIGVPVKFKLYQNYPNPFNSKTVIKFDLNKSGHIKLEVYNVLGEKVAVLYDGYMTAGYGKMITWDAKGLPSGVYYYRLIADGFTEVKKMVLVK